MSSVQYEIDSAHEKLMKSFSEFYFHNLISIIDQIVDCKAFSFNFSSQQKKNANENRFSIYIDDVVQHSPDWYLFFLMQPASASNKNNNNNNSIN